MFHPIFIDVPNVTKQDLIQEIARSTGYIQADIRTVVEEFFDVVAKSLTEGDKIELRGFGTFSVKNRKSRPARNPRTGEEVQLAERVVPLFKFSSDIKGKLNQNVILGIPAKAKASVRSGL